MTDPRRSFQPDWISRPGDTIADLLEERGWSQSELAARLGYTTKHVCLLLSAKATITEDTAIRLERVLGSTTEFWLTREAQFRAQKARLESAAQYGAWADWLEKLPLRELMKSKAIPTRRIVPGESDHLIEDLLRFFGVASPDEWAGHYVAMEGSFRRSREEQSDIGAISAWLRQGEIKAERIDGPKFDRVQFLEALKRIRGLTVRPPESFEPELRRLCKESGVVLVLVPSIPRSHVSGVARWLGPHRALIQLSLYGKTNDRFWFTLFHEAAHILHHGKREVFLDYPGNKGIDSPEEMEANRWAGDSLIPPAHAKALSHLKSKDAVKKFARDLEVHPGIVVGRLQHDGLVPFSQMNDLKVSFRLGQ